MFSINDPEVFWLTTTNLILGLVVLACIVIVARAIYQEIRLRNSKRNSPSSGENRAVVIPLIGPTMADGGEPVARRNLKPGQPLRPTKGGSRIPHTEN